MCRRGRRLCVRDASVARAAAAANAASATLESTFFFIEDPLVKTEPLAASDSALVLSGEAGVSGGR